MNKEELRATVTMKGELKEYVENAKIVKGTPHATTLVDLAYAGLQNRKTLEAMPEAMKMLEEMAKIQNAQMKLEP